MIETKERGGTNQSWENYILLACPSLSIAILEYANSTFNIRQQHISGASEGGVDVKHDARADIFTAQFVNCVNFSYSVGFVISTVKVVCV